jgi:hypothetical protein
MPWQVTVCIQWSWNYWFNESLYIIRTSKSERLVAIAPRTLTALLEITSWLSWSPIVSNWLLALDKKPEVFSFTKYYKKSKVQKISENKSSRYLFWGCISTLKFGFETHAIPRDSFASIKENKTVPWHIWGFVSCTADMTVIKLDIIALRRTSKFFVYTFSALGRLLRLT